MSPIATDFTDRVRKLLREFTTMSYDSIHRSSPQHSGWAARLRALTASCALLLGLSVAPSVWAQASIRQVSLPNQDYTESTEDLVVKVLGGKVVINRTWTFGRWYLNGNWADLVLQPDPMGGVLAISRADRIYTRLGAQSGTVSADAGGVGMVGVPSSPPAHSSGGGGGGGSGIDTGPRCELGLNTSGIQPGAVYTFDENNYIRSDLSGWQWYDRIGNTIDYDIMGRMLGWTSAAGVKATLVRDGMGRIMGVKDHQGQQVITVEYAGGGNQPTRVSDATGRSVSYEWTVPTSTTPPPAFPTGTDPNKLPATSPNGSIGLGQLTKVVDARGKIWTYTYNAAGYLATRIDPEGGKVEVTYMAQPPRTAGRAVSASAGSSGSGSAGSGGSGGSGGVVSNVDYTCGNATGSTKVTIPQAIRVASLKDELGGTTNYRVDYDRVKREYHNYIQLPNGATQYLRFDNQGRRLQNTLDGMDLMRVERQTSTQEKILDARGLTTIVQFDSAQARRPLKIIHPDGSTETFAYDGIYNRRTRHVNTLGVVATWTYDAKGNVLSWVEAQGKPEQRTTIYTYDQWGQMLSRSRGAGDGKGADVITERFEYDMAGNRTKVTNGEGQSATASFDVQGLPLTETSALGQTTTNVYDANGNLSKSTNPLNHATQYSYDGRGRLVTVSSPLGHTQTATYDKAGHLATVKDPLDATTTLSYTPLGLPKEVKMPSGATYSAEYTGQGRISKLTDPAGNVIQYRYGGNGDLFAGLQTATVYPTYQETYGYNQRDIRTKTTQAIGSANNPTRLEGYDALGQRVSSTDPLGNSTQYQWDALGRLTQVTDALGGTTKQTWDAQDNLLSVTDAKGNTHQFAYDKAGRQIKETRPLGGVIQTVWDAAGQLSQRTNAGGNQTVYTWDAGGNLTQTQAKLAGGQVDETTTFTYNSDGELTAYEQKNGQGSLISSASYTLDALGRRLQSQLTYAKVGGGAFTHTLAQGFSPDGQLQSQQYPDGSQQTFAYDKGLLKQIQLPAAGQSIDIDSYEWLFPKQISTPGATISQTPDALQRFAGIKVQAKSASTPVLLNRTYQYDAAGGVTQIDSDIGKTDYAYDKLNRLTQASPDNALQAKGLVQEQYSYDATGNRLSSAHQAGTWAYNADNQLTQYPRTIDPSVPGSATEQTDVSYTPQGHIQRESSTTWQRNYGYNAGERLTEVAQGPASGTNLTVRYHYDPFGRRIAKTVTEGATTKTTYYLNGEYALLAEADDDGKLTRAYGFNPDTQDGALDLWSTEPLWQADLNGKSTLSEANFHYLATDHLGTPILATDKQGNKTWRSYSEAFGNTGVENGSSAEINLRFPGQYWDKETGLHQNYFRDYSPARGRYVQSDPTGLWGGLNTYGYAYNDPLGYIDPTGEVPIAPIVVGYLRCVVSCTGQAAAMEGLFGDLKCFDPAQAAKDCALSCANPLNWFGKFKSNLRKEGTSWTTKRRKYWKENSPTGEPPTREVTVRNNKTGEVSRRRETKELHHDDPQRNGGSHDPNNLREVWPTEHADIDPHRRPGYTVIKVH